MAVLTIQNVTRAGVAPVYDAAAVGGDQFTPGSDTYLHVKNGDASAHTVTVASPGEVIEGVAKGDVAVSVPASGERVIGPFPAEHFADPADGLADVTYDGVTSVTIGAFKVSKP